MSNIVYLRIGQGDFTQGFAEVWMRLEVNKMLVAQESGSLPPQPELHQLYENWRFLHEAFYEQRHVRGRSAIEIEATGITGFSEANFRQVSEQVRTVMQRWLSSEPFMNIERQLRTMLNRSDTIEIILETQNDRLPRLPWHFWRFVEDYPNAEIAFSRPQFTQVILHRHHSQLRILAIFGNSHDLNLNEDIELLKKLNIEPTFLVEPSVPELTDALHDTKGWDILFFAGHSSSRQGGQIELSMTQSVAVSELKYGLRKAIEQGLKLAIFNSCDGLGLAQDLADLNLSIAIVMREAVPNRVAQDFLKYFLENFVSGQSLHLSVRKAREQLQGIEQDFPCATWLPTIFRNPAETIPTWQTLRGEDAHPIPTRRKPLKLRKVAALSMLIMVCVVGIRSIGILGSAELWLYDRLMQIPQPGAALDSRMLLVTINDEDVQKFGKPISDLIIAQALSKLTALQPRAIGLDVYRDPPSGEGQKELVEVLKTNSGIVALCRVGEETGLAEIKPPPGVPQNQQGFADALLIDSDEVIRRYILAMEQRENIKCRTQYSFAFQLLLRSIDPAKKLNYAFGKFVQIGGSKIPMVNSSTGVYATEDLRGSQILLRYQPSGRFEEISLNALLSRSDWYMRQQIRDRIVLIGYATVNTKDVHPTPVGKQYGVRIHAQALSQLLDAVEGRGSVLGQFNPNLALWVGMWTVLGGVLANQRWRLRSLSYVIVLGVLLMICIHWFGLTQGAWFPFLPAFLGYSVACVVVLYFALGHRKNKELN
ncbi:CHASE2 domain-containing protein [Leptolyngbya sp. AN03gr2]|uniref:CHASE2 domain-containing protein n=1 Tax=unclassified Leptolyngbya TaxID=2650499 RepID=UPI003D32188F